MPRAGRDSAFLNVPYDPAYEDPFLACNAGVAAFGLVVGCQNSAPSGHDWFVFESSRHRLQKSSSDMNGTDPLIFGPGVDGILRKIRNALSRRDVQPAAAQMRGGGKIGGSSGSRLAAVLEP